MINIRVPSCMGPKYGQTPDERMGTTFPKVEAGHAAPGYSTVPKETLY